MSALLDKINAAEAEVTPKLNEAAFELLVGFCDMATDNLELLSSVVAAGADRAEAAPWEMAISIVESFGGLALSYAQEMVLALQTLAAEAVGVTAEEVRAELAAQ